MKILLFGISNVGKTTIGTMLAKQLGYSFYDLDEEVKKEFKMTLEEFVHTENLRWRDQKKRSNNQKDTGAERKYGFCNFTNILYR